MSQMHYLHDNILINKIIDLIEKGSYKCGDRLPSERELAELLHTNRNTLREALRVVQTMGIIEVRHGSGIYLLQPDSLISESLAKWLVLHKEDVENLHVVREILEIKAVELIPQEKIIEVARDLQACLAKINAEACTVHDFIQHDIEFHGIITTASQNNVLATVYRDLTNTLYDEHRLYASILERRQMSYAEHTSIAAAFSTGNANFIKQVLQAHNASVKSYILNI